MNFPTPKGTEKLITEPHDCNGNELTLDIPIRDSVQGTNNK